MAFLLVHGGSFNETFQIICNCHFDYFPFLFFSGSKGEQKIPCFASNYVIKVLLSWNFNFTTLSCELQNNEIEINQHQLDCKMTGRGLQDSKLISYCVNDRIKSKHHSVHFTKTKVKFYSFLLHVILYHVFQCMILEHSNLSNSIKYCLF